MSFAVSDILAWTGGQVANAVALGPALERIRVERPAHLAAARESDIAFFFSKAYQKDLLTASPGILITGEAFAKPLEGAGLPLWKTSAIVVCKDPYFAMALISEKLAAKLSSVAHVGLPQMPGVHPTAVVHPLAEVAENVVIGPYCVVESGAKIGFGTVLYPHCYVGPGCFIGDQCVLFPGVTLYEWTQVGKRVRIHAGSVLGSDGFGYAPKREPVAGEALPRVTGIQKIYHLGRVVVGDDAEIGANVCVDRGTFGDTRIDRLVKLDNDVHVGHNASIGEGSMIAGGTALAGSAKVGRFCIVGGLTGITNQVEVGDGASIGAVALITKDIPPGGTGVGNPQREYREHFRAHAALNKLAVRDKTRSTRNEPKGPDSNE